jgi:hypothetical protein
MLIVLVSPVNRDTSILELNFCRNVPNLDVIELQGLSHMPRILGT